MECLKNTSSLIGGILSVWLLLTLSPPGRSQPVNHPEQETTLVRLLSGAQKVLFSQPDSAFLLASQALQLANQEKNQPAVASCHQLLGKVYYYQGVYNEALDHLLRAEKIFQRLNDWGKLGDNLNQQGQVYYIIRQPERALQHHQEALKMYQASGNAKGVADTYGWLGRLYEKKQSYAKALYYQNKALAYYENSGDQPGLATILENIGSVYEDQAKYTQALAYFQRSVRLNQLRGDSLAMIVDLNNIGDIYRKTGAYANALAYTKQALALATRLNERDQVSSAYKDLGKTHSLTGDYQKAYQNLELGRTLYEELYTFETTRQLNLLQTLFGMERKNAEIQLLENNRRLDRVIKIAMGSGIGLIALLGMVIISRQRLKILTDKELIGQNQRALETQTKLIHSERENAQLREVKLQQELEAKSKSLTAHTLHIIGKNKTLEEIRQKLTESLADESPNQRKKLKSLVKLIDFNFVQDKDWDDFRRIFEQVHQDFFTKLQQGYPDLTPTDIRLAALIKLNLPYKDMATTLGVTGDSLRIGRYRLKKKLGLEPEDSLSHFIQSL